MVKMHMSEWKYDFLGRYDNFLYARKDKINRYYILFLFFYKDYFLNKLITKLMRHGRKWISLKCVRQALWLLKKILGFQPFFFFKHISFRMRQLFKIQKTTIRKTKIIHLPLLLKSHNQVTYGINHLLSCAKQLCKSEKKNISEALCIILLNCFVSRA